MDGPERAAIEELLGQPVEDCERAGWGFTNRTDIVTLARGERVVLQRYRRRRDAKHRVAVMRALLAPARAAGIALPEVRQANLDAEPAWVVFASLPGLPVPSGGGLEGPLFPSMARSMGELLAAFRGLSPEGVGLDDLWADPVRLARRAEDWVERRTELAEAERSVLAEIVDQVPGLFAGRDPVLAHGDYSPVNVLTDGDSITGLLDFECVRLADPLLDVAWWHWSVSFSPEPVLESAWPAFLKGARVDGADPLMDKRVRALQVLRMLELLDADSQDVDIERVVLERLRSVAAGR